MLKLDQSVTQDCDVLVIGGGLGGLSAALTTSHQNLKTILIEKQDTLGGKAAQISKNGYTLDPGPSICIMKWVYEDLFKSTGADISDYLTFEELDPIFSLITEDGNQIVLPAGRENFLKRIQEFSPEDVPGFEKLFQLGQSLYPLVKKTFFSRSYESILDLASFDLLPYLKYFTLLNNYKTIIDTWFKNPILKAWLYSFPTYTGQSYHSISPGALIIPYIMICEGIYYPSKGIGAIPAAMNKRAAELETRIIKNTSVTEIHHQNNTIRSVILSDGTTIYPKAVISAIDKFETEKLLKMPSLPSSSYSYVSLQIGVSKKFKGLTHHNTCIPKSYEDYYIDLYEKRTYPQDPVLYIHAPSVTSNLCSPVGHESLFIVIPTYATGRKWRSLEKNLSGIVLDLLRKYRININKKDIVYSRVQTPNYFAHAHGNYLGSLFGPDESRRIGKTLPPGIKSKDFTNLAYCGGGVQPGAGMPMVTLSGQFAANYISSIV